VQTPYTVDDLNKELAYCHVSHQYKNVIKSLNKFEATSSNKSEEEEAGLTERHVISSLLEGVTFRATMTIASRSKQCCITWVVTVWLTIMLGV